MPLIVCPKCKKVLNTALYPGWWLKPQPPCYNCSPERVKSIEPSYKERVESYWDLAPTFNNKSMGKDKDGFVTYRSTVKYRHTRKE